MAIKTIEISISLPPVPNIHKLGRERDRSFPLLVKDQGMEFRYLFRFQDKGKLVRSLRQKITSGRLLIGDTDTIPGFLSRHDCPKNLERIFQIKKRPLEKKFLLLAGSHKGIKKLFPLSPSASPALEKLVKLWPGELSCIFPLEAESKFRKDMRLISQEGKIALRIPNYSILRQALAQSDFFCVAPSANLSGQKEPQNPHELLRLFQKEIHTFFLRGDRLFAHNNELKEFLRFLTINSANTILKNLDGKIIKRKNILLEDIPYLHKKIWSDLKASTIMEIQGQEIHILRSGAVYPQTIEELFPGYQITVSAQK